MKRAALFAVPPVLGLVAVELVMQPATGARVELGLFFTLTAGAVAAAAGWWSRWARRIGHLGRAVLALAVASVLGVGAAVTAASGLMFIDAHDLQLLWIVVGFALILGIVFAITVSEPLTADLERIAETARRVGRGDLDARTRVSRRDEVGAVAAALDDTAARLAEMEADRRREQDSRQAFLTAIGHDLRTPLSALRAAVEALSDGVAVDTDRYVRAMREDVRALSALVEDLFLLARIESGSFEAVTESVDLSDLADEALEALRPVAASRGVDLVLDTPGHVRALGGSETLSRVIRNLVDNAIRHSPRDGTVVVSVAENGSAVVEVVDQGRGFRPEFVPRAFESFSRDDEARARQGGGAGLGLAIARGFVEAYGGAIWAEPGPGGRVAFRVPTVDRDGGRAGR